MQWAPNDARLGGLIHIVDEFFQLIERHCAFVQAPGA
jgi:hypothetical protein